MKKHHNRFRKTEAIPAAAAYLFGSATTSFVVALANSKRYALVWIRMPSFLYEESLDFLVVGAVIGVVGAMIILASFFFLETIAVPLLDAEAAALDGIWGIKLPNWSRRCFQAS